MSEDLDLFLVAFDIAISRRHFWCSGYHTGSCWSNSDFLSTLDESSLFFKINQWSIISSDLEGSPHHKRWFKMIIDSHLRHQDPLGSGPALGLRPFGAARHCWQRARVSQLQPAEVMGDPQVTMAFKSKIRQNYWNGPMTWMIGAPPIDGNLQMTGLVAAFLGWSLGYGFWPPNIPHDNHRRLSSTASKHLPMVNWLKKHPLIHAMVGLGLW